MAGGITQRTNKPGVAKLPIRKAPVRKASSVTGAMNGAIQGASKAMGSATNGTSMATQGLGAYEIMAQRIANRVAEFAENMTLTERNPHNPNASNQAPSTLIPNGYEQPAPAAPRRPRKLDIRPQTGRPDEVSFSAPFLDNTLEKMLALQNRMLKTGSDIAKSDASEKTKKEQFAQSAELSKIIALICAEKARQGA
ncbi:hypothetical protein LTR39_000942 [Cryomyces antarcticus]|nr:hypothetical protein LTR39_000942 [Cryomyces antarcticus]KAK5161612.1 hypothetical protein LTR04_004047 [Oleoguttula sp. CCFEE 6159]